MTHFPSSEQLMLVLFAAAVACFLSALSVRTLRRTTARWILFIGSALATLAWFTANEVSDRLAQSNLDCLKTEIGIGIFIGLAVIAWRARLPSLNPKVIHVALAHAQAKFYRVATDTHHMQIVTPAFPIKIPYAGKDNVQLCFGVDKGEENDGIPLINVRLGLWLTKDAGVHVAVEQSEDGNPYHKWKHYRDAEYFYDFEKPLNRRQGHTWRCLRMTFPTHGDYELVFTIAAEGIGEIIRTAIVRVLAPPP